jgi:Heparinase II/III-like protein
MIVDQGVFQYAEGHRRQMARSAFFHNTVCFEGADQADFFGAFRCGRRPDVGVLSYSAGAGSFVLEGTHNGFDRLSGKPKHTRLFEAGPSRILIRDRIENAGARRFRASLLLHPEVELTASGGNATLRRGDAIITIASSAPLEAEPAVWWPDMGVELGTRRLVIWPQPDEELTVELSFASQEGF